MSTAPLHRAAPPHTARHAAAERRRARQARVSVVRRRAIALALTLFVGVWGGLATQLTGNGSASSARHTTTTAVVSSTASASTAAATQAATPTAVTTATS